MKKKILFFTQDLERTGSEMVLWHLLQHLDHNKYVMQVFCLRKGILYETLPPHVEKSIMYKYSPYLWNRIFRVILKVFKVNALRFQLRRIHKKFKADLWFINTIVIPEVYDVAKLYDVKVVTYVHELLNAFTLISASSMRKILAYSDVCIGCSEEVCNRISEMGHKSVKLQSSFIDTDLIKPDLRRVMELREEYGFLSTDFVWVVSGRTAYMKGLDHIISILSHFEDQPVKILWVGGHEDSGLEFYVQQVAEQKYPGKLFFAGPQSVDYYNYLAIANGLLLLSREESFSLVLVEAAKLGLPVVSFDLGIASKFITEDMGRVVKDRNINDFIAQMQFVQQNANFESAKIKSAAMEYSVHYQMPKFENLMAELIQ